MKTKKLNRRRTKRHRNKRMATTLGKRPRFSITRKRVMKGGERPNLNVLKGINLFNDEIGKYINPFYGCVYVELNMINTIYNLYKIPVNEPTLDTFKTQHNRLIGLVFRSLGDAVEPINTLRDSVTIHELSHFIALRLIWTMYPPETYDMANEYIRLSMQLNKLSKQLLSMREREMRGRRMAEATVAEAEAAEPAETEQYTKAKHKFEKLNETIQPILKTLISTLSPIIPYYSSPEFNIDRIADDTRHPISKLRMITDDVGSYHMRKIKQLIPLGTPMNKYSFHILMALLWHKCPTKRDIMEFYTVLKEYIDIFLPLHTFDIPDGFAEDLFAVEDMDAPYETLDQNDPYMMFYYTIHKHTTPAIRLNVHILDYTRTEVQHDGDVMKFTDCGETTIRNLIRIVAYNNEIKGIDMERLTRWGATPTVIEYFTKYPVGSIRENSKKARDEWATLVSHHEGIIYLMDDICELNMADLDNTNNILTKLFRGIEGIYDLQIEGEGVEILNATAPENAARVEELTEKMQNVDMETLKFIILFKGVPQYIYVSFGVHAHIERVKLKVNADDEDDGDVHEHRPELLQYSEIIYTTGYDVVRMMEAYDTMFNPFLINHNYLLTKYNHYKLAEDEIELYSPVYNADGISLFKMGEAFGYEIIQNPKITDDESLLILASNDMVPYRSIAYHIISRIAGGTRYIPNMVKYIIANSTALNKYIDYDDDHKITFYKLKLLEDEFIDLENSGMISRDLYGLKLVNDEETDSAFIHNVIDKYPNLRILVLHDYPFDYEERVNLPGIVYLSLYMLTNEYTLHDTLKTLYIQDYADDQFEYIPKSVETLILNGEFAQIPDELPNLSTLHIFRPDGVINTGVIPSTVKVLHVGASHLEYYKLYPYFSIKTINYITMTYIEHIPDNVEELYIHQAIRGDVFMMNIKKHSLPKLKKLGLYMDRMDGQEYPVINIKANAFRELDMDAIELIGCAIAPDDAADDEDAADDDAADDDAADDDAADDDAADEEAEP
jgi:hypothetical protein